QVVKSGQWPGLHALFRNHSVNQIIAICTAEEIMKKGLPADRIDRISLCGDLPFIEEWTEVLDDCGRLVERIQGMTEILKSY
ncbi:MAG: hypothetical protein HGA81_06135, partial [Chlorobium limicola]|nr:hypothetical protein [Chlorobium limicola]